MSKTEQTALVVQGTGESTQVSIYSNAKAFEEAQRFAKALVSSDLVPEAYKGRIDNALVALEMANRMNVSPLMVMQNLDIIKGKPSFSSKFLISMLNSCGQFSPLRFNYEGEGDKRSCIAYATELRTGEILKGPKASIEMAKKEGWYGKERSKWPSMPDLMLAYRSAAFFQRLYAPELSMGIQTAEEVIDITPIQNEANHSFSAVEELNQNVVKKSSKKAQQSTPVTSTELESGNTKSDDDGELL
ncbi:MAG: hypothetical protein ACK505_06090 [Flavobacteriales bacterium]|jgi:hypothetical protein